jgi:hypothetical protein
MMLTYVADARVAGEASAAGARRSPGATPLQLSHRLRPTSEAVGFHTNRVMHSRIGRHLMVAGARRPLWRPA